VGSEKYSGSSFCLATASQGLKRKIVAQGKNLAIKLNDCHWSFVLGYGNFQSLRPMTIDY
jgi:hypothetical protein